MARRVMMESELLSKVKNEPSLCTIAIGKEELDVMTLLMTKSIYSESLRLERGVREDGKEGGRGRCGNLRTVCHNDTRELREIRVRKIVKRSGVGFYFRIYIESLESGLDN
jgi:hypothetical protein